MIKIKISNLDYRRGGLMNNNEKIDKEIRQILSDALDISGEYRINVAVNYAINISVYNIDAQGGDLANVFPFKKK